MVRVTSERSTALLTDYYELTMLQAALRSGVAQHRSVFEVDAPSVRKKMKDKAFARSVNRQDIVNGRVDVRVLAAIAYLHEAYGEVTVSCLISGHRLYARPGVVSAHVYGRAVDVAALSNVSITGHQQPGGNTEQAVRSLLMLPGGMLPKQVISLLGLGGPSFPLANHYDHVHVGF